MRQVKRMREGGEKEGRGYVDGRLEGKEREEGKEEREKGKEKECWKKNKDGMMEGKTG